MLTTIGSSPTLMVMARVIALSMLMVLSGCLEVRSAVKTESVPAVRASPEAAPPRIPPPQVLPTPPPPPPPPPRPDFPLPPDVCVPTHDGACAGASYLYYEGESLAREYREHRNFRTQWGLRSIRADYAYGHLNIIMGEAVKPGAGVTIGFLDSGIDQDHRDFSGKTLTEQFLFGATDEKTFTNREYSHGTAVASVAAAAQSLFLDSAHGVAWGADIAMFAIPSGLGDRVYVPITLEGLAGNDADVASMFNHVLAWRSGQRKVDVLNVSVGYEGIIDNYSEQELRDNFATAIAAMAQQDATEKTILVWAAGNAHGDYCDPSVTDNCENYGIDAVSVEVLPGLAARIDELQGHSIAVVALRRDGQIADWSNRCGIASGHCIAAPGEEVRGAFFGNPLLSTETVRSYADFSGTSFAAPMVAGGLALMKQLFRDQLSNTELVTRLYATANNSGRYANQEVYGSGAMDLRAATWPVGVLDVPVGSNRGGNVGTALLATRLHVGEAFGDGPERSLADHEIAAFDALGAPFWFDLGEFATAAAAGSMTADFHHFIAPLAVAGASPPVGGLRWQLGFPETPAGAEGGHLALAENAMTLTVTDRHTLTGTAYTTEGISERAPTSGAALSWQPSGSPLGLQVGWMHERATLLGSSARGAFGTFASDAAFVGVTAEADFGGWQISADAEFGAVDPEPRDGLISRVSPLTTSAVTLQASRSLANDGTLRLSVSQPLRVETGRATLNLPTGRTRAGAVVRSLVSAELTPSGRQFNLAAEWQQPLPVGELRLGAVVTHQPGHRAAAEPELTVLSGWRWSF